MKSGVIEYEVVLSDTLEFIVIEFFAAETALPSKLAKSFLLDLYDSSLNAVAFEARYVVDYMRDFPITVRELGFRAMITSTMWINENFGICTEAFYYNPRTRTLSTISDEKISASIEREEVTYDQSKILE